MKKLLLALLLVGTVAQAEVYIGLGASYANLKEQTVRDNFNSGAVTAIVGMTLNDYVSIEARGALGEQDVYSSYSAYGKFKAVEIKEASLYFLTGYGSTSVGGVAESGGEVGVGLEYDITMYNLKVFGDIVYKDGYEEVVSLVGLKYSF